MFNSLRPLTRFVLPPSNYSPKLVVLTRTSKMSEAAAPPLATGACRNVEIKARLRDVSAAHTIAARLAGVPGTVLQQKDVFYTTPKGRLKSRTIKKEGDAAPSEELIYYDRPDTAGPKTSTYHKVSGSTLDGGLSPLHGLLTACLGVRGEVAKQRTLFIVGQTRVHLDRVEGLGDYMELEVMLRPEQTPEEGQVVAHDLMKQLGVREEDLLQGAYMDMIQKGEK